MPVNTPSDKAPAPTKYTPIVAIGGSAGGQEAITELLDILPVNTGFAYVYIQHLSPNLDSHLDSILGRATPMPVKKAGNRMAIEPNHVYIIPPNREMEVIDGKLMLMPRKQTLHMPIDRFFISLSERQKAGAIAILLSGLATDGTLGLKAVKVAGGITMAQDETAHFQTMPKAAIAEGVVDLILSAREMATELIRLSQRTDVFRLISDAAEPARDHEAETVPEDEHPPAEEASNDQDIQAIIQYVRKAIGVDFSQYKMTTIRRRIIRRMLLYHLDTLADYTRYLQEHADEARVLYNDLLINVTSFFRDAEAMSYLGKVVLPELIRNKAPGEPLRIWVPACSTGQEAYSLAMLLLENMGEETGHPPIHIFATDLSEPAINKARQGIYTKSEVLDVSPKRLQRFFTKLDNQYRIHKNIRDLCVFAPHNLFKDPPFSRLDLISCRNLLIYLDGELQRRAFATFHYALKTSGFLLLGKSETVNVAPTLFTAVEKNYRVYNRRNEGGNVPFGQPVTDRSSDRTSAYRLRSERTDDMDKKGYSPKSGSNNLSKVVDDLLLNHYVPASVVVDQELEILQFRGSTGLFLEPAPGKASLNLLKMARPTLVFELRNAVHKANKSGQSVRKDGLTLTVNGKPYQVAIEAVPLAGKGDTPLFLILFTQQQIVLSPDSDSEGLGDARIRQLEDELTVLREDMHSIIEEKEASNEELQSANEEIVSSNEELQSINEELETGKEEIESTNEELLTINQELQLRNDQLTEAYGYAEAIFDTIAEATLLLDKDLSVKSANKAFYTIFKVKQEDTEGKLIYELGNRQWDIPQLRQLLERVITQSDDIRAYEVTHTFPEIGEKIMRLNARKVVQHERQEAVLLAIEDITDHRRAQRLLEERQAWFRDLMDNAPTLVWVSTVDATFGFVNRAWLHFTGTASEEVLGKSLALAIHPDDQTTYLSLYATSSMRRLPFTTELRMQRHDGEYRWMQTSARPQFNSEGVFVGFIGSSLEVHLQKTLNQELDVRVQQRAQQWTEANMRLERANNELQQTADRLQSVINGVPASITLMDVVRNADGEAIDFKTAIFNEWALTLTGQTASDIASRTLLDAHPDFKTNGLFDQYVQVLNSGIPAYDERELGGTIPGYYAFYITRQIDANGLVVTVLNITDRKVAEAQVRQTADGLQAVLDSSPASIGMFKARRDEQNEIIDFTLLACNQRFVKLIDHSSATLIGASVAELSSFLWLDDTFKNLLHILKTGEPLYEERHDTTNGIDNWLALSLSKHDDGVVITGLDITPMKLANQQRLSWLKELERSDEMLNSLEDLREHIRQRGEFLHTTTHDLRGSFGVIAGAASLLNEMDTEEERAEMLAMLQRNLRHVTQMLTQLLDYSRLEAGREQFHDDPFDAAANLRELLAGLQAMAAERNLFLRGVGPDVLPVQGDMVKLSRIVQNLILNALIYTQAGGVTVNWQINPGAATWFFEVRDTGPGFPDQLADMLRATSLEPAENHLTTEQPGQVEPSASGTGIGLQIVKRLCNLLAARITVESEPDKGTQIRVELPRRYDGVVS